VPAMAMIQEPTFHAGDGAWRGAWGDPVERLRIDRCALTVDALLVVVPPRAPDYRRARLVVVGGQRSLEASGHTNASSPCHGSFIESQINRQGRLADPELRRGPGRAR
jgi:hypothetical protein